MNHSEVPAIRGNSINLINIECYNGSMGLIIMKVPILQRFKEYMFPLEIFKFHHKFIAFIINCAKLMKYYLVIQ